MFPVCKSKFRQFPVLLLVASSIALASSLKCYKCGPDTEDEHCVHTCTEKMIQGECRIEDHKAFGDAVENNLKKNHHELWEKIIAAQAVPPSNVSARSDSEHGMITANVAPPTNSTDSVTSNQVNSPPPMVPVNMVCVHGHIMGKYDEPIKNCVSNYNGALKKGCYQYDHVKIKVCVCDTDLCNSGISGAEGLRQPLVHLLLSLGMAISILLFRVNNAM